MDCSILNELLNQCTDNSFFLKNKYLINTNNYNNFSKSYDICNNFETKREISNKHIGYTDSDYEQNVFILLTILGLLANGISLLFHFKGLVNSRSNRTSAMDKLLLILIINDFCLSLYYLLNSIFFYDVTELYRNCYLAFSFSLINYFLIVFNITFSAFTVQYLKLMIIDPIEGILRAHKQTNLYLISSLIISVLSAFSLVVVDSYGVSPMLTPLIKIVNFESFEIKIAVFCNIALPFLFYLYMIYLIISIFFHKHFRRDEDLVWMFSRFVIFAVVVFFIYFPFFILYFSSFFENKDFLIKGSWMRPLSIISYLFCCIEGFIICSIRIFQGHIKFKYLIKSWVSSEVMNLSNNNDLIEPIVDNMETSTDLISANNFHIKTEDKMIKSLITSIFIGVSYSLNLENKKYPYEETPKYNLIDKKTDYKKINTLKIKPQNIDFEDEVIKSQEQFSIKIHQYAPKPFHFLKCLDKVENMSMFNSFKPEKNIQTIEKSRGKGGSFFISTADQRFLLKTVTRDETDTIVKFLLSKYVMHMKRYPNSLLCPIYGLFSLEFSK